MEQDAAGGAQGRPRIGRGVSADVFLIASDRVLKLLLPGLGAALAEREFAAARIAHAASLPVPEPIGVTREGDRYGIVFQRVAEARWARRLRRMPGPVMPTLAAMARLQARCHAVVVPAASLPSAHALLEARCREALASPAITGAALRALAELPHGDRLLHGDLHLGNVITARGQLVAVDWAQAMVGDPAADVARTDLLMRFGRYGPALRRHRWLRIARHAAADWYLFCYTRLTGMKRERIDAWQVPTAVAWMRADSAADLASLSAFVERRLARP